MGDVSQQNLQIAIQLHLRQNSYQRAVTLIDKSMLEHAISIDAIKEYLYWLNKAKLFNDSERILTKYLSKPEVSKLDKSALALYRAAIYADKDQYEKATVYFDEAINFDPNNAQAMMQYGHFLLKQKRYIKAETLFLRAQAFEETMLPAMLGRAQIYINTNDMKSAHTLLIDINHKYPDTPGIKAQIDVIDTLVRADNQIQL